ncbi:MAG TPA: amidohydrolase family protein [Pirellulales bacterium]|nr:amidohydrolase family protein [Pirellulales bacterium]
MDAVPFALKARYVFPVSAPPLEHGVLTLRDGKVVSVGRTAAEACEIEDVGNVAILPGLINAHAHLELSDAPRTLGGAGMSFPDWIRCVIEFRRGRMADPPAAIRQGLQESLRAGTTTIGDIVQPGWPEEAFEQSPLAGVVFLEAIGLTSERGAVKLAEAREHLAVRRRDRSWRPGLSPHAPYSVRPELFAALVSLAAAAQAPIAFHLAESREELQLLDSGDGPFCQLFESLGVWDPAAIPPRTRPLDYLRQLAGARVRSLVIHGNYLDDEEIALAAQARETMSVVYCPRTHAYFGHERHPLPRLLAAGANVAIGTDSRASNPDLSVFEELRFVARQFPELPAATVLELATLRGAEALGLSTSVGSLSPGKLANLAIVRLPDREAHNPYDLLFDPQAGVEKTFCRAAPC